jgi:hypothetical protein
MPQNSIKNYFLVVMDYFTYKNGSIGLVRGLFSSLDIGTYILSTCGPSGTFSGPFSFLIVLDYFSGVNILPGF